MTDTLQILFQDTLKDLYNAERQFLKAMPAMEAAATEPDLKEAIRDHIQETEGHVQRLQRICDMLGITPTGKVCQAAHGLVEEAKENLDEVQPGPVLDAAIIICAQKNEHYEICSYGTLEAWAKELNLDGDLRDLLKETLGEESGANERLGKVAKHGLNKQAKEAAPVGPIGATLR